MSSRAISKINRTPILDCMIDVKKFVHVRLMSVYLLFIFRIKDKINVGGKKEETAKGGYKVILIHTLIQLINIDKKCLQFCIKLSFNP